MKKLISTILMTMIVSPVAFGKQEPVAKTDYQAYKNVVKDQKLTCGNFVDNVLGSVSEIYVDKTGTQPALFFRAYGFDEKMELTLYTSQDQQRVTKATAVYFRLLNVNRGSVVAPRYVDEWVSQGKYDCSPGARK